MRIFTRKDIVAALDETAALAAVERAIIAFAAGQAQSGDAGHFSFPAPGDAHGRHSIPLPSRRRRSRA